MYLWQVKSTIDLCVAAELNQFFCRINIIQVGKTC